MRIDLHTHTNFSDGSLSPQDLIEHVKKYDVGILAITDHDEILANIPAMEYGKNAGVEVIAGVELSIDYPLPGRGHLHLLGLFIDSQNEVLVRKLRWLSAERRNRAAEIIKKLRQNGVDAGLDELAEIVGEGSAGRPHVARLLMDKGVVSSVPEAFYRYLGKDAPAYVPKKKLDIQTAIDAIHQAQGLAILAHPISLGFETYPEIGTEIMKIKALGLDGVEAYYSSHDRYFTKWMADFARENDLVISGGSDFHGQAKPNVQPGTGRGDLRIPVRLADELKQYRNEKYGL